MASKTEDPVEAGEKLAQEQADAQQEHREGEDDVELPVEGVSADEVDDEGSNDVLTSAPGRDPSTIGVGIMRTPVLETELVVKGSKKKKAGSTEEHLPVLEEGTWVQLGATKNVPSALHGHIGHLTRAPKVLTDPDDFCPVAHWVQDEDTTFDVHVRDQYEANVINLTRDDFTAVSTNGRPGVQAHG